MNNYIFATALVFIIFCSCMCARDITVDDTTYKNAEFVALGKAGFVIKTEEGMKLVKFMSLSRDDRNLFLLPDITLKDGTVYETCMLIIMSKSVLFVYQPFKEKKLFINKKELSDDWKAKLGYTD